MWKSLLAVAASLTLLSCAGEETASKSSETSAEEKDGSSTALRRDSRRRLLRGRAMELDEILAMAEDFSEKVEDITLVEAKECRIGLYALSMHFEEEREDGFDGDFRKADRDQEVVNRMTFAYYGFDRMVKRLEVEEAMDALGNAPESVKRQVIREGIEHSTAENLIWCDFDSLKTNDMDTPSFNAFCAHYDDFGETLRRRHIWRNFYEFCHVLQLDYLDDGLIDPASYEESLLR